MERSRFTNIVNENFTEGDLWATFTYGEQPCKEVETKEVISEFIKNLGEWMAKHKNEKIKCVATTNYANGKYHHHLITNFPDKETLEDMWHNGGRNQIRKLTKRNSEGLERYMQKDAVGKVLHLNINI